MNNQVECPSRDTLDALLDGTLQSDKVVEVENHVGNCDRCLDSINSLSKNERWQEWKALLVERSTLDPVSYTHLTLPTTPYV